jgi:protein-disulfide isomerase
LPAFAVPQSSNLDNQFKNYIMNHPEVIMASIRKFQLQQQQRSVEIGKQAAIKNQNALLHSKYSPSVNNGKMTVVEFFDYQCSVCHMMFPVVEKLIKQHPNVRVVYKEFPIFGPASVFAAKASIAAHMQGEKAFRQFHNALFKSGLMEGKLKNGDVLRIAKEAGLDMDRLKADMNSKAVESEVKQTYALTQALKLGGTPAFVVMPTNAKQLDASKVTFIPGGTQYKTLEKAITQ